MNDATFDNLTRLLGSRPSRRQVLKGIAGGGTLAVAGMTSAVENAAAQCLEDGVTCAAGTECCSGACSASLGVCVTMDECVADGDPCTDGSECCGGACSASLGVCVTMDECVADGLACSAEPVDELPAIIDFGPASFVLTAYGRMNAGTIHGDQEPAPRFLGGFFRI